MMVQNSNCNQDAVNLVEINMDVQYMCVGTIIIILRTLNSYGIHRISK